MHGAPVSAVGACWASLHARLQKANSMPTHWFTAVSTISWSTSSNASLSADSTAATSHESPCGNGLEGETSGLWAT